MNVTCFIYKSTKGQESEERSERTMEPLYDLDNEGLLRMNVFSYRSKKYEVLIFDSSDAPIAVKADISTISLPRASPVLRCVDSIWTLVEFLHP